MCSFIQLGVIHYVEQAGCRMVCGALVFLVFFHTAQRHMVRGRQPPSTEVEVASVCLPGSFIGLFTSSCSLLIKLLQHRTTCRDSLKPLSGARVARAFATRRQWDTTAQPNKRGPTSNPIHFALTLNNAFIANATHLPFENKLRQKLTANGHLSSTPRPKPSRIPEPRRRWQPR